MLPRVRAAFAAELNGYVRNSYIDSPEYIVVSAHGPDAGLIGALHLASIAAKQKK